MDYSVMLDRRKRMVGADPKGDRDLIDVVNILHQYPAGVTRHVIAEKLLQEMAEFIEAEIRIAIPPVKH